MSINMVIFSNHRVDKTWIQIVMTAHTCQTFHQKINPQGAKTVVSPLWRLEQLMTNGKQSKKGTVCRILQKIIDMGWERREN